LPENRKDEIGRKKTQKTNHHTNSEIPMEGLWRRDRGPVSVWAQEVKPRFFRRIDGEGKKGGKRGGEIVSGRGHRVAVAHGISSVNGKNSGGGGGLGETG